MLALPDLFSLCAGHGHRQGRDKVGIRARLIGPIAALCWICYRILFVNCVPGHNLQPRSYDNLLAY